MSDYQFSIPKSSRFRLNCPLNFPSSTSVRTSSFPERLFFISPEKHNIWIKFSSTRSSDSQFHRKNDTKKNRRRSRVELRWTALVRRLKCLKILSKRLMPRSVPSRKNNKNTTQAKKKVNTHLSSHFLSSSVYFIFFFIIVMFSLRVEVRLFRWKKSF